MKRNTSPISSPIASPPASIVPRTFDFSGAVKLMIREKACRRVEWADTLFYCKLMDLPTFGKILSIHKPDGKWYPWIINDGDLLGMDWYEVAE